MPFSGFRSKKPSRDPAADAAAAASAEEYRRFSERIEAMRVAERDASVAAARAKHKQNEQKRADTWEYNASDVADSRSGNKFDEMPLFGVNWKLKNLKKLFKRRSRGQSGAEGRHHRSRHHRSRHPSSLSRKYNKSSRRVFRKKSRATRRRR